MSKFKVGDRVRRHRGGTTGYFHVGDTGTVSYVDSNGDCIVTHDKTGRHEFNLAMFLELVEQPAKWEPKIGDRVRWLEKFKSSFYTKDKIYEIKSKEGDDFLLTDDLNSPRHTWPASNIRRNFLPAPAVFKIEAGKFYKTRDGRKVGPMRAVGANEFYEPKWKWRSPQELSPVNDDGRWHVDRIDHPKDLVAEWIDEPAIANDNAAPSANLTAIVALIENGQPKPSETPFVHSTESAAQKEAKRLAGKYRGKKFGVYVLTTTSQEEAPTYEHEWQRLAAKGEKIGAIRELRAATGLHLTTAKTAVEDWVAHIAA